MSYVVLARKWRPQSFEDLVGQEHVSATLGSAIAHDRVAHAFLFTGVRGVGKTTSARILAKALNCTKGPTATPCLACPQCLEIAAGSDVDVQEIDGASYNGVDEVRRLQESLPYRPSRDRFKIYIVDEVHMLSNAAWNAFLKTLEEPPPHVKFIFATTEVHKVPVTILSRCQRYDFKMLSVQDTAARLRHVLTAEGVPFEEGAIATIAREAAGSMRDGMSLLDQVVAWVGTGGATLTGEGVARVLGVAARSVLHRLGDALVDGDPAACVRIVGELAQQGFDLAHVARDFLGHLRDLVIAKVCDDPTGLLDLADGEIADVRALAARTSVEDLTRLQQGFSRSFDDIVRSGQPRAALEMALVRLSRRPALVPVDELIRRLAEMERRLAGGGAGPGGGGAPRGGATPDRGGGSPTRQAPPQRAMTAPEGRPGLDAEPPPREASPAPAVATFEAPVRAAEAPVRPTEASMRPAEPMRVNEAPPTRPAEAPPTRPAEAPVRPAEPVRANDAPVRPSPPPAPARVDAFVAPPMPAPPPQRPQAPQPARPSSPPAAPMRGGSPTSFRPDTGPAPFTIADLTAPAAPLPTSNIDLGDWRAILEKVREKRAALASVLEHAGPIEVGPLRVSLRYPQGSFLVPQATERSALLLLETIVREHFASPTAIDIEVGDIPPGTITVAQLETFDRKARVDTARRAVARHPLVSAAIELLGAELRDVRLAQEPTAAR